MESTMIVNKFGTSWYNEEGHLHRTDGPAEIWEDGSELWYANGKLHREDGPAVIWPFGQVEWWLNGKLYSFNEWAYLVNLDPKTTLAMALTWNPQ